MLFAPDINFAQPQAQIRGLTALWGWVLLGSALLAMLALIGVQVALMQRMEEAKAYVSQLQYGAQSPARLRSALPKEIAAELEAVDRVARRMAIPWAALFQALEAAKTERVVLLAVQPNGQQGDVRVLGEADDFSAVAEFVTALAAQPGLSQVHLAAHEMRGPSRLQFEIIGTWTRVPLP